MATATTDTLDTASLQALLGLQLTAEQALFVFQQGQEAVVFELIYDSEVSSDNNHAERQIRPAVMLRKNSDANGSKEGAETQSVLMSVFRTLKQRGHNPVSAVLDAFRAYLRPGQLPPPTGEDR